MKKVIALLMIVAVSSMSVVAEPLSFGGSRDIVSFDSTVPRTIIPSKPFSLYPYKLSDNSPLPERELRFLLNTVPANDSLLRQENGLRIASLSFLGVGLWAFGYFGYSVFEKSPDPNLMKNISVGVQVGSVLGYIITDKMRSYKLDQAIRNYNLYIMGVPVPGVVQYD